LRDGLTQLTEQIIPQGNQSTLPDSSQCLTVQAAERGQEFKSHEQSEFGIEMWTRLFS
jgi:hypothetical protein